MLDLREACDAAFRPVHMTNMGSRADGPADAFWKRIYEQVGLDDTDFTVESFVDCQRLRAYFNTHAFAVRPALGLFRRWLDAFDALVSDR